jgi:hypothetical protein
MVGPFTIPEASLGIEPFLQVKMARSVVHSLDGFWWRGIDGFSEKRS